MHPPSLINIVYNSCVHIHHSLLCTTVSHQSAISSASVALAQEVTELILRKHAMLITLTKQANPAGFNILLISEFNTENYTDILVAY